MTIGNALIFKLLYNIIKLLNSNKKKYIYKNNITFGY